MAREISFVFNGNTMKMMIADHWTLLHLIREELGYGNMIHAFKNYTLRNDEKYKEKFFISPGSKVSIDTFCSAKISSTKYFNPPSPRFLKAIPFIAKLSREVELIFSMVPVIVVVEESLFLAAEILIFATFPNSRTILLLIAT